ARKCENEPTAPALWREIHLRASRDHSRAVRKWRNEANSERARYAVLAKVRERTHRGNLGFRIADCEIAEQSQIGMRGVLHGSQSAKTNPRRDCCMTWTAKLLAKTAEKTLHSCCFEWSTSRPP